MTLFRLHFILGERKFNPSLVVHIFCLIPYFLWSLNFFWYFYPTMIGNFTMQSYVSENGFLGIYFNFPPRHADCVSVRKFWDENQIVYFNNVCNVLFEHFFARCCIFCCQIFLSLGCASDKLSEYHEEDEESERWTKYAWNKLNSRQS